MATNLNIDVSPLLKAAGIFSAATRKKILGVVGKRIGVAAEAQIPGYPPPSGKPLPKIYTRTRADGSTYLSAFKSQTQQGKVFSLIKAGEIPYGRTGLLGRSITSGISDLSASSVTIKVGTAIKYAPLVIGDDTQQSAYHRGTWWQLNKVLLANQSKIEAEGTKSIAAEVTKELKV